MGFRYRKSINLGGGFRINLSKSGVGYSWGTKGYRITKTAKGKIRSTTSIPGMGISYTKEYGGRKQNSVPDENYNYYNMSYNSVSRKYYNILKLQSQLQ